MKRCVLVVDDDQDIRTALWMWLQRNYEAITAEDGAAALAVLERQHVDIVLLDLMMPVMDGYELKRRLDGSGNSVPIVIMSAMSDRPDTERLGPVAGWLEKPFTPKALDALLDQLLPAAGNDLAANPALRPVK